MNGKTGKMGVPENFFYSLSHPHLQLLRAQNGCLCARKRATLRLYIEGPCFFTRRRAWVFSGGLTGCAEHARPLGMPGSGPRGLAGDTGRHSDVVMGTRSPAAIRAQTAHPAHRQPVKGKRFEDADERRCEGQNRFAAVQQVESSFARRHQGFGLERNACSTKTDVHPRVHPG